MRSDCWGEKKRGKKVFEGRKGISGIGKKGGKEQSLATERK